MSDITLNLQAVIPEAGFWIPDQAYYKHDPRGKEYGHFRATVKGETICVRFLKPGEDEPVYTMYFHTAEDFKSWASDRT